MLPEPNYTQEISQTLDLKQESVEVVLELISEGATVPFIARYRKEKTGWLDENQIRDIIDLQKKIENLYKAKGTAINGIEELWAMTDELMNNILKAKTLKEVEEIYKPYKSKKKTKAMLAIEKWFGVVADLAEYSEEEILEWSVHIISAEISANADLRADLIDTLEQHGTISSKHKSEKMLDKLNDKDKGQIQKFEIYKEFSGRLNYLKPYQVLALNRWENLWILSVKIDKTERTFDGIMLHYARLLWTRTPFIEILLEAFTDGYNTLFKSVENEVRGMLSEFWEDDAIDTFQTNLGQLLMTKPEYGKTILAIDPWFHAWCKMTVLDTGWNPILFDKIFLRSPDQALMTLKKILSSHPIDTIVVWNGTGVNETVELLQQITKLETFIVNESGASVYSASKVAQEEFPDLDSLDRGTVSIWRRYIDPLSELVKIPVGSIGVGMYQHDIPEKKLEEKLGFVVEDTVNEVGINVNTASSYVLNHISGINKTAAKKIYNHRPYKSRQQLKKQLRQYGLAKYIASAGISSSDISNFFRTNESKLMGLYSDVTEDTVWFILESLESAGAEKRVNSTHKRAVARGAVSHSEWDIVE